MWAWVVVVPFTPDEIDVGDLAVLVLIAAIACVVGWAIVRRWRR
jgi:hypothetical protein